MECSVYVPGTSLTCFGDISVTVDAPQFLARSAKALVGVYVADGKSGRRVRYIGSSAWEGDIGADGDCTAVIFGSHGPKPKNAANIRLSGSVREIVVASTDALPSLCGVLSPLEDKAKITLSPELWNAE